MSKYRLRQELKKNACNESESISDSAIQDEEDEDNKDCNENDTKIENRSARHSVLLSFYLQLGERAHTPLPPRLVQKFFTGVKGRFPKPVKLLKKTSQTFLKYSVNGVKQRWNKEDRQILIWIALKLMEARTKLEHTMVKLPELNPSEWDTISKILGLKIECVRKQWHSIQKHSVRCHPWTQREDDILREMAKSQNAPERVWKSITEAIFRQCSVYRTPRQVRARWHNYVNTQIKKEHWSRTEDQQLLTLVTELGKRWSLIAQKIPGRNYNQVKNRFSSLANKLEKKLRRCEQQQSFYSDERKNKRRASPDTSTNNADRFDENDDEDDVDDGAFNNDDQNCSGGASDSFDSGNGDQEDLSNLILKQSAGRLLEIYRSEMRVDNEDNPLLRATAANAAETVTEGGENANCDAYAACAAQQQHLTLPERKGGRTTKNGGVCTVVDVTQLMKSLKPAAHACVRVRLERMQVEVLSEEEEQEQQECLSEYKNTINTKNQSDSKMREGGEAITSDMEDEV